MVPRQGGLLMSGHPHPAPYVAGAQGNAPPQPRGRKHNAMRAAVADRRKACHLAVRRQDPRCARWQESPSAGAFRLDPVLREMAHGHVCRRRQPPAGRTLATNLINPMDNQHPSFGDRIAELKKAANMLRDSAEAVARVADVVMAEAQHMEAAQSRFAARAPSHQRQTARR